MTNGVGNARRRHWILAAVAVGVALRLHGLEIHSLWFDETMSAYIARSGELAPGTRIHALYREAHYAQAGFAFLCERATVEALSEARFGVRYARLVIR